MDKRTPEDYAQAAHRYADALGVQHQPPATMLPVVAALIVADALDRLRQSLGESIHGAAEIVTDGIT